MRLVLPSCVVRWFDPADASSLALHANNRKVWLNLRDAFRHPYSLQNARQFIDHARNKDPESHFAIAVDGEACGSVELRLHSDLERCSAKIGCWLGEVHWGRSTGTAVLRAVADYAMKTFDLTRVFAVPYEWNAASCRMLENAGYVLERRTRRSAIKNGHVLDQLLYSFVREE